VGLALILLGALLSVITSVVLFAIGLAADRAKRASERVEPRGFEVVPRKT
jgi:hypothetical protein